MSDLCNKFFYGEYELKPAPIFSSESVFLKTPDGSGYGTLHNITFEGSILLTGEERSSGIRGVMKEIDTFQNAFSRDGRQLHVYSLSGEEPDEIRIPLFSGFPKITSLNINPSTSNDNFTSRADYTFSVEMVSFVAERMESGGRYGDGFNDNTGLERQYPQQPPFIESISETWNVELEDRLPSVFSKDGTASGSGAEFTSFYATVTHTYDIVARLTYTGDNEKNDPFKDAMNYATGLVFHLDASDDVKAQNERYIRMSGLLQLDQVPYFSGVEILDMVKNHRRNVSFDRTANSIQVQDTFLLAPEPNQGEIITNLAREDFTVDVSYDAGVWNFRVAGEVQGLAQTKFRDTVPGGYFWTPNDSPFTNANNVFKNDILPGLRRRAQLAASYQPEADEDFDPSSDPCSLTPLDISKIPDDPFTKSFSYNPAAGTISYDVLFQITPIGLEGCDLSSYCIQSQQLTIEDTKETDLFATQVVLGRSSGPILQDLGTKTAKSRTVTLELTVPPPTSILYEPNKNFPTGCVSTFLGALTGVTDADQVFITQNVERFGYTAGTYTRILSFTYATCETGTE